MSMFEHTGYSKDGLDIHGMSSSSLDGEIPSSLSPYTECNYIPLSECSAVEGGYDRKLSLGMAQQSATIFRYPSAALLTVETIGSSHLG
ncbi:hypothetical protein J6590_039917 [Homalodisca vitripennis]|nr:hypothetical protein J6590_039917 [Homalodisca vitripennis]